MPRTFEVTYSGDRASKKRKKFQDGFITVDTDARNQFNISLHSENKKKRLYLGKGKTITRRLFDQEISSFDLVLGQYEVNVASEVGIDAGSTNYIGETESPKQIKRSEESSAFQPYQCDVQILAESKSISELPPEYVLNIDRSLKIKMRPHQIEAAEFLLSALHPINSIGIKNYLDSAKGNKFETEPNQTLVTGAILADSMGLGKTLVAISVLWALIKFTSCKCAVLCPASLIENWKNEFKKWMGTRLTPVCIIGNNRNNSTKQSIEEFKMAHPSKQSVIIISYDQYRIHSAIFEGMSDLDTLVCDEGHILKNIDDTQTMIALRRCPARRRLLITGTPVQNDLDELYTLVNFVAPGILGTCSNFRKRFNVPITNSITMSEGKASGDRAVGVLTSILHSVIIRRTHEEILSGVLPPRLDISLCCSLSPMQQLHYDKIANRACRDRSDILGHLQDLRRICNFAMVNNEKEAASASASPEQAAAFLFQTSNKLYIIDALLQQMKKNGPKEKVVIVSNFTAMLNLTQNLCTLRGWSFLRLDGSTAIETRQSSINRFNTEADETFVFFLSTKAGGVGLNLTGAHRLILIDYDWNPATDDQAMARIWRQGQSKKIFVYRLISDCTLEMYMKKRQNEKKKISKSLQNNEAAIRDLILTSLSCINDMQSIEAKTRCEMLYSTENELNGMTNITPKSFLDCGINRENKNNPEQQDIILIAEGSLIYETCRFIENENKKVLVEIGFEETAN